MHVKIWSKLLNSLLSLIIPKELIKIRVEMNLLLESNIYKKKKLYIFLKLMFFFFFIN